MTNITFASENTRCANMLNAVLRAHGEDKTAQTYDFVEGGIPSHYFWGSKGLNSEELDKAIWSGWCEGLEIQPEAPQQEAPEPQPEQKPQPGAQPQQGAGTTAQTGTGTQPQPGTRIPEQTGDNGSGSSVPVKQSDDDKTEETEFESKFAKLFKNGKKGGKDGFNGKVSEIKDKDSFCQWLSTNAKTALINELGSLNDNDSINCTRKKGHWYYFFWKPTKEITITKNKDNNNKFTVTITKNSKQICDPFDISIQELEEIPSTK